MILLIDNYDSFSYNLYQYVGELTNGDIKVVRNDKITVSEALALAPTHIILSPGPGYPASAGICEELLREAVLPPVLGVCLGHQAICEVFGGVVARAKHRMHGKQSLARVDSSSKLFRGLPEEILVARYHSLAAESESLPEVLRVTARAEDGTVMAVEHIAREIYGVQFHPESVLTPLGKEIIRNFLGEKP